MGAPWTTQRHRHERGQVAVGPVVRTNRRGRDMTIRELQEVRNQLDVKEQALEIAHAQLTQVTHERDAEKAMVCALMAAIEKERQNHLQDLSLERQTHIAALTLLEKQLEGERKQWKQTVEHQFTQLKQAHERAAIAEGKLSWRQPQIVKSPEDDDEIAHITDITKWPN